MNLGPFSNAHNFVLHRPQIIDITVNHARSDGNSYTRSLSPLRNTAPRTSPYFTGQELYLKKLHEHFGASGECMKLFLLYGMGGIGKTQICLKFRDEMELQSFTIFWVDASSKDTIDQSLKDIYKTWSSSQTPASSFSSTAVLHHISSLSIKWLMIFDNADGAPELLEKYLPPGNTGNVLITSRNPELRRITTHSNSMEVMTMNETSSVELLIRTCESNPFHQNYYESARTIVAKLNFLPLAIDMAGAYIARSQCGMNDFIMLYEKYRANLMNDAKFQGASGYNRTVYNTWEMSFQKITDFSNDLHNNKRAAVARYALNFINICAFIHHENISSTIFERAARYCKLNHRRHSNASMATYLNELGPEILNVNEHGEWNEWRFKESMELLLSFSLIKKMMNNCTYSIHPLVQACCQDRLSMNDRKTWILNSRAVLVSSVLPENSTMEYIFQSSLLPHIIQNQSMSQEGTQDYYHDLFTILAGVLKAFGVYNLETRLRARIFEMQEKQKGAQHIDTITSMENLASSYFNVGRWVEAEQLQVQVVNRHIQSLGTDHLCTATSMHNLAWIYYNQGRWAEAEKLQLQVMRVRSQVLGNRHLDTVNDINNLALTYLSQGKWSEAEQMLILSIDARKQILGLEHPSTLTSIHNLARTNYRQGKWRDAEKLQLLVLEIREKVLGSEHPEVVTSINNLALTYVDQGKFSEAEQLQIKVLNLRTQIFGTEHPYTHTSMHNLARTYIQQGRYTDAENLQLQVTEMRIRTLGIENPYTLNSMNNLAITYRQQRRLTEAETILIEVLRMRVNLLGMEHPETLASMADLTLTYRMQDKWPDAEKLGIDVLGMRNRILGQEHPDTLASMNDLACVFWYQGKREEARYLLAKSVEGRTDVLGMDHPLTRNSVELLALMHNVDSLLSPEDFASVIDRQTPCNIYTFC